MAKKKEVKKVRKKPVIVEFNKSKIDKVIVKTDKVYDLAIEISDLIVISGDNVGTRSRNRIESKANKIIDLAFAIDDLLGY